ncbi:hypothetical protein ACJMK2_032450 [Sinanodonta woodiana]|uniref:Transporter n=1 Tax=Sinanodonta woodiana TaxID=1069815 RepID=A0ABD3X1T0_SINWO
MSVNIPDRYIANDIEAWRSAELEPLSHPETVTDPNTVFNGKVKPKIRQREIWARKIDFLLACIGFSVGLGNVWRFPFLCYKNGGGAFLIPYFISVIIGGIPVFFLEVSLGQFMSEGGIGTWKICPLFQGIGYASAIIVFLLNCDYNVILSWAFYYLFASFTDVLPWSHCNNAWNTQLCTVDFRSAMKASGVANATDTGVNETSITVGVTKGISDFYQTTTEVANGTGDVFNATSFGNVKSNLTDPVTEFWERKVLQLSTGIGQPGTVKWDLALCLLLAWIVVYFCIWKGIKSSGKVVYFTATSPYILIIILLVRGVTLDGAVDGLKYYLLPDWSKVLDSQVWVDAATQIFFSYSISLGTLTALGSYNRFNHNCYRDSLLFAVVNSFTSLLAGTVIFSVLGFMARRQGVSVAEVAESGPGLAFIAYPEAVAQMPLSPLWSGLFFLMIILLGLDSQFMGVEGFITAVVDLFPNVFRRGYRREVLIGVVCAISFLIGLSMVSEGGMYVFQLFDFYSASRIILVVAFFECVVVAYLYGVNRFYDNLEMMFGFRLLPWMKICWSVLTPLFTMGMFVLGAISYSEVEYKRKTMTYQYPTWAIAIGWMLASVSVIWIPIIFIYKLLTSKGSFTERFSDAVKPHLKRHQLRQREDLTHIHLVRSKEESMINEDSIYNDTNQTNSFLLVKKIND